MAPLERVSRTRPVGVLDVDAHKQGDEPDHDAHDDDADDRGTGAAVAVASRELPEEEASPVRDIARLFPRRRHAAVLDERRAMVIYVDTDWCCKTISTDLGLSTTAGRL